MDIMKEINKLAIVLEVEVDEILNEKQRELLQKCDLNFFRSVGGGLSSYHEIIEGSIVGNDENAYSVSFTRYNSYCEGTINNNVMPNDLARELFVKYENIAKYQSRYFELLAKRKISKKDVEIKRVGEEKKARDLATNL